MNPSNAENTMTRRVYKGVKEAREDLGGRRTKPPWLVPQHALPFNDLSPDEFEVLCFLLLLREHPSEEVCYYGKTGDAGRDIIHRGVNAVHLVQCKRFELNVGVGEVQAEIAKLCTNVHRKVIPDAPVRVSFYASRDLTARALDLLRGQSVWRAVAEEALTKHLKQAPGQDLLDFARSWWPDFRHQGALEITERLKRHPDLLDEFFAIRKVVDVRALEPIATRLDAIEDRQASRLDALDRRQASQLDALQRQMDLLTSLQQADALEKLRLLVEEAEAQHPELKIDVNMTAKGPIYHIRARENGGPARVGWLSFPDTPEGQEGRAKYERMRETGRGVELLSGEFEWEPEIPLLMGHARQGEVTRIQLEPRPPSMRVPVRLDCRNAQNVVTSLPFAFLRPVRVGTKEAEIELLADRFAAKFCFDLKWGAPSTGHSLVNLTGLPVGDALTASRFLQSLSDGAHSLEVFSLERGHQLFVLQRTRFYVDELFEDSILFLEHLEVINRALGSDFRHPEDLGLQDRVSAAILASNVEGRAAADPDHDISELLFLKPAAVELLRMWREGAPAVITHRGDGPWPLLESKLDVGDVVVTLDGVRPLEPLDDAEARIATAADADPIALRFKCERVIYAFSKWVRINDA